MFCWDYGITHGRSASRLSFGGGVPMSELGCADARVESPHLGKEQGRAGRENLSVPVVLERCRETTEWMLLMAWAHPDTGRNWRFRVLSECRNGSSPASSSSCNWASLPGLSFKGLTKCKLQASFQTCAFNKISIPAKLL